MVIEEPAKLIWISKPIAKRVSEPSNSSLRKSKKLMIVDSNKSVNNSSKCYLSVLKMTP